MTIQPIGAMCTAMLLLTCAWAGLAAVLGNGLGEIALMDERTGLETARRWTARFDLHLDRPDPCSGEVATLRASLALDAVAFFDGDEADLMLDLALDDRNAPDDAFHVRPLREHAGARAPLYGEPTPVHSIRAPVLGGADAAELVVTLASARSAGGGLAVAPVDARLVCTAPPPSGHGRTPPPAEEAAADLDRADP
jgi:hypothetical protein